MALINDLPLCTSITDDDYFLIQKSNGISRKITYRQLMSEKGLTCLRCGAPAEFLKPCKYCGSIT